MHNQIYLDNHATTQVDPRVLNAMLPFFTVAYGNPSSIDHTYGNEAAAAVAKARSQVAKVINASPEEIFFTSGATESDNMAILGVAKKLREKGNHIITTTIEHKAVLEACRALKNEGFEITYLSVDKHGKISLTELKNSITPRTILISIMAANNEIGTINPLEQIGKLAREHNIIFHTDAAQAYGHIPLDVKQMSIDIMSISAHKLHGPKGVGAIFIRQEYPAVKIQPLVYGGGQEGNIRPGTLNVPGIVGLGVAAEMANEEMNETSKRVSALRDQLYKGIKAAVATELNGSERDTLPHNLNLFFPGIEAKALINEAREIAISAGSACTSTDVKPSHVITALGYNDERAYSSVRFGLSRFTSEEDIKLAIAVVVNAVKKLERM